MDLSDPDIAAFEIALKNIFDSFDKMRILHEELLEPLINCAASEGPWIRRESISGIYNEWISKARRSYLDFVTVCCDAEIRIRRAAGHSLVVKQYITLS